jgi:predicted HTH transcriptional regulator
VDIKDLVGETTEYDKKLELETKKPKSWCKSVSAFANGFGGKLIYGVSDDGTLVGLTDAEDVAEKISEIMKERLNPIPEFKLSFEKVDTKKFVVLEVYSGKQTPYYYAADGQLTAFVRIGNESVPATPMQLRELVLKGSGTTYDTLDGTQGGTQGGTHSGTHDGTHGKTNLDEQIVELIRNNPNITQTEIAEKTDVSLRTIKRRTVAIKNITYVGSGDKGHWEVRNEKTGDFK